MPARPSHLPNNAERTFLQKMSAAVWLPAKKIYPTSKKTLAGMLAKGWVERQLNASVGATYRITAAGQAALKAKIPLD